MSGVKIEIDIDIDELQQVLAQASRVLENPKLMFAQMGEAMLDIHQTRFAAQTAPDGTPWQPLADWYKAQKSNNADKILTLDGYLGRTLAYHANREGVEFGSNRPYAAIHQFGGVIKPKGNYPLKLGTAKDSPRAQSVTIPARPWLGLSVDDEARIIAIAKQHLAGALTA